MKPSRVTRLTRFSADGQVDAESSPPVGTSAVNLDRPGAAVPRSFRSRE